MIFIRSCLSSLMIKIVRDLRNIIEKFKLIQILHVIMYCWNLTEQNR